MKKILLNNFLALVLTLGIAGMTCTGSAVAKSQHDPPPKAEQWELTGVWEFTLTGMSLQGDLYPEATSVVQVKLYDTGNQLLGMLGPDRLVGFREGKTVSLTVHSNGENDFDVKAGGIQEAGEMRLKLVNKDTLTGQGVSMSPAEGLSGFDVFQVTAIRTDLEEPVSWSPSELCKDLDLGDIIADIFGDLSDGIFEPMDPCDISKDGEGYYVFGTNGPGPRLYATTTIYFPWKWDTFCSVRDYGFSVSSGGSAGQVQTLLDDLKDAEKLLAYIGIDASSLVNELSFLFDHYGEFAISFMYNMNTGFTTMFINLGLDTPYTSEVCYDIQWNPVVQKIKEAFDLGGGLNIKCGHNLTAGANLKRSVIPDYKLQCSTPVGFFYLLGTIEVNYN
jgi:hypothetical protein